MQLKGKTQQGTEIANSDGAQGSAVLIYLWYLAKIKT